MLSAYMLRVLGAPTCALHKLPHTAEDYHLFQFSLCLHNFCVSAMQIDPWNHIALQQHAACAAAELPLDMTVDGRFFGEAALAKAVSALVAAGQLGRHPRR